MIDERFLKSAQNGTKRAGQKDLLNHLAGKRTTRAQAIKAKCYDCNGMGESDICESEECALFPYSPYRIKPKINAGSATFIEASAVERASKKAVS